MSEITKAVQALCDEKGLSYEAVLETIEAALAAAYRKDFGNKQQNIKVKFDPETGDMQAWDIKTVVEDIDEETLAAAQEELINRREKAREENRELTEEDTADLAKFNPKLELMKTPAKEVSKKAKVGDVLEIPLEIKGEFGRMAAQTAKQVIIQKIREAERGLVFEDYKKQEGQIIVGTIQRVEGRKTLVDLGKITGIMPSDQGVQSEFHRPGARVKFLVQSVNMSARGPEIILSRNSSEMVRSVFKQEIPEVGDGVITIKGVARDAGYRSKVAVFTEEQSIDPIGSCIGQRGSRINTVIEELGGEKIDIIQYSEDPKVYIAKALAPAKVLGVELHDDTKEATVYVATDQFSLAIGRNGQNVRLASELTGWKINVKEQVVAESEAVPAEEAAEAEVEESKE
ncbi:MAG: transcription termination factor NusA [bacterium]|nr:transcription termination factor NusA [bacterium]